MVSVPLPPRLRVALYLLTMFGTPVVVYLRARGVIGDTELTLWSAEVAVASAVAAFNVPPVKGPPSQ